MWQSQPSKAGLMDPDFIRGAENVTMCVRSSACKEASLGTAQLGKQQCGFRCATSLCYPTNLAGYVCANVCGSAVVADLRIWGISLNFSGTFSVHCMWLTDDDKMAKRPPQSVDGTSKPTRFSVSKYVAA